MKYYPNSQVKLNQKTSGGKFINSITNENYKGDYYSTSDNKFFTGKSPSDGENYQIFPSFSEDIVNQPKGINSTNYNDPSIDDGRKDSYWTLDYLSSPSPNPITPSIPLYSYPTVLEEDYVNGQFNRYFLSKINEPKFIEIDSPQYGLYVSKDPKTAFKLYQPLKINWVISGVDRNKVHATNHQSVKDLEKSSNSPGFTSYFKGRFSLFYK